MRPDGIRERRSAVTASSDAAEAVVEAEMDGRMPTVAHRRHLLAHEDVPGKVEAELGREPRQGDDEEDGAEREPQPVAASVTDEGGPVASRRGEREPDREHDAERWQRVDPACVEIILVDDARDDDERAEADRRPHERPRAARDRRQRDPASAIG